LCGQDKDGALLWYDPNNWISSRGQASKISAVRQVDREGTHRKNLVPNGKRIFNI